VYAGKVAYKYKGAMPEKATITLQNGTVGIMSFAFGHCTGLTSITIPSTVTSIGDWAFSGCTNLRAITVAEGNTAYFAQDGVLYKKGSPDTLLFVPQAITGSVTIPSSVTSIGYYAFYDCPGLTSITVAADNPQYSSQDGVLFDKAAQVLLAYPGGKKGAYSIPSSVTSIGRSAFEHCTGLRSVTIPGNVTSIGHEAFYGCTGLTSVMFKGSNTIISPISPGTRRLPAFPRLHSLLSAGGAEEKNGYKMAAGTYTLSGDTWTKQ
jgi:hypothetical protein